MQSLLGAAGTLVNLVFLLVVLGTIIGVAWLYRRYQKHYAADKFPWKKTGLILGIEILSWIGFNIFWSWVRNNFWIALVILVIIVVILIKRKKR